MGTVDLAIHFPQGAVVDGGASQQAEEFYRLDG